MSTVFRSVTKLEVSPRDDVAFATSHNLFEALIGDDYMPYSPMGGAACVVAVDVLKVAALLEILSVADMSFMDKEDEATLIAQHKAEILENDLSEQWIKGILGEEMDEVSHLIQDLTAALKSGSKNLYYMVF